MKFGTPSKLWPREGTNRVASLSRAFCIDALCTVQCSIEIGILCASLLRTKTKKLSLKIPDGVILAATSARVSRLIGSNLVTIICTTSINKLCKSLISSASWTTGLNRSHFQSRLHRDSSVHPPAPPEFRGTKCMSWK